MRRFICTLTTTIWLGIFTTQAQVDSLQQVIHVFSLEECVQYALQHQRDVVNARLDQQYAREQIRESTGKLLPHADITGNFQDNLKLQTSLIPDFINGNLDQKIPVQFGTKYTSNLLGQVNQTIFNSDYFIGLKAAKVYEELSEKNLRRTAIDTRVAVMKAYYAVLVNGENIRLTAANEAQLRKTLADTKARYDAGVGERVDVDRITVSYNNVVTSIENQQRLLAYSLELLKFQAGIPQEDSLQLSQTVQDFSPAQVLDTVNYRIEDRVEYSQQLTQIALNRLNLKSTKMQYLPSLTGFINYGFNYFSESFGDLYKRGFGTSAVGLNLSWPLFTGTERLHRVNEQKITLQQSINDLNYLGQQIQLDVKNAYTQYRNNLALLRTQETNMELTQGVYDRIVLKYDQGVSSSLDVISAESELRQAQSEYVNALLNTLMTKLDLDKAMGKIR
ncbi:TolC family protein [Chitinophaga japonensis]|uniref:Outer membrane protein TolC n=1 Tax=Chitinophaga japonensis TaxID=104662 RepID=A0A562T045_CHIJA|nr:TolC family protein [Chitinophaga japonensis]TWI86915.1 outer membrane protein TolC [Chitinophaga japonensis]